MIYGSSFLRKTRREKGDAAPVKATQMNKGLLVSIHRHWLWADRMQRTFFASLNPNLKEEDAKDIFISNWGMCMCLWYGLLFAVCEGLREGKFAVPTVQAEIDGIYEDLKLFRHAVFHVQKKYWSPKLFRIMQDKTSAFTIKLIHDEIGNWLLTQLGGNAG